MKKNVKNLLAIAFLSVAVAACGNKEGKTKTTEAQETTEATEAAVTYQLDAESSLIDWKGRKPGTTHTGTINLADGSFSLKEGVIESGNFTIDINSIVVTDLEGEYKANLEAHLKGTVEGKEGDFFNAQEFPTGSFEVTGVRTDDEGKTWLEGNLTLKGISKNIAIPVSLSEKGSRVEIKSEPFLIDRTEWDMKFGSKSFFDSLGDNFVHDDVELTVSVVAVKS